MRRGDDKAMVKKVVSEIVSYVNGDLLERHAARFIPGLSRKELFKKPRHWDRIFPSSDPVDLLTPLGKNEPVEMLRADGMSFNRNVVARLKPGITIAQAGAEMEVIHSHLPRPGQW